MYAALSSIVFQNLQLHLNDNGIDPPVATKHYFNESY